MRRAQRVIEKRDLQSAVKHGICTVSFNPRGYLNYRYVFADIVYITDETSTKEITSWAVPGAGLDVAKVLITPDMKHAHGKACRRVENCANWTSHTVIVVDQSGSMRKTDVPGGATRSDAVWLTIALEFVAKQLDNQQATETDIVSVISMSGSGMVIIDRMPHDWLLFNSVIDLLRTSEPHFDGNYMSALDAAERLLMLNSLGNCALALFFLSDGKPSDHMPSGRHGGIASLAALISARIDVLCSHFGRRLAVTTFGFAGPGEGFEVLESMAARAPLFGSAGRFISTGLSLQDLSLAFSTLAASTTATRTELTALGGSSQRAVRDVRREASDTLEEHSLSSNWYEYMGDIQLQGRSKWALDHKKWVDVAMQAPNTVGVAMRKCYFGEGAERLVRKFRECDRLGNFVGPTLVCKESRFVGDSQLRDFHQTFCETQMRAAQMATAFNERMARLPSYDAASTPRIEFLDCSVYIFHDQLRGRTGVLVEKMLDQARYKKWNDNCGGVDGQAKGAVQTPDVALNRIMEEEEEEEGEDDEEGEIEPSYKIKECDIPQAFSHFTYRYSRRKSLVCDLQGVLSPATRSSPPAFEFTDPVIHYKSSTGRKHVFGRTDRGKKGMSDFFQTHDCGELCRMLNRRWVKKKR